MTSEMLTERGQRNTQLFADGSLDSDLAFSTEIDGIASTPVSSPLPPSSPPSSSPRSSLGANCIHHRVSKMDTLAGVAIKYGVEVADIKRLNGLVTDLQMFAHKSLQIPLPGRHPPSPSLSNVSVENGENTPMHQRRNDVLDLKPPRRVSPAMSRLQGYYGLASTKRHSILEAAEIAVYKSGRRWFDDELLSNGSPTSDPPPSKHRKSRSMVIGFLAENGDEKEVFEAGDNSENERSVRRRQRTDGSPSLRTPELLLKEDSNGGFSGRTGKGLAPRLKPGSRIDTDLGRSNGIPNGDPVRNESIAFVRKSSSTSCLQESDNSSSMWPTSKWILKPDILAMPYGLPKSITAKRNKTALD